MATMARPSPLPPGAGFRTDHSTFLLCTRSVQIKFKTREEHTHLLCSIQSRENQQYRKKPQGKKSNPPPSGPRNKKGGKNALADPAPRQSSFSSKKTREAEIEMDLPVYSMPNPPAGFVVDDSGCASFVAPPEKRIITIDDPQTGRFLDCMIRRSFLSSQGQECLLLIPLDTPLQILKFDDQTEGVQDLTDQELNTILPAAAYALAKKRLHLVFSGFCLTLRGSFCYSEEDVMDLEADYGYGMTKTEGVEITAFRMDENEYMIYTPFDPVLFVACKDKITGDFVIADDDLMEDMEVVHAIEEENEFQALVDEEESVNETLRESK